MDFIKIISTTDRFLFLGTFEWSVTAALATIIGVIFTVIGISAAAKNVKKSQEPYIGLYLTSLDPENLYNLSSSMVINIENFGLQVAQNVKLTILDGFDKSLLHKYKKYSILNTSAFNSKGISSIAPGQKQKYLIAKLDVIKEAIQNGKYVDLNIRIDWEHNSKQRSDFVKLSFEDYIWNTGDISSAKKTIVIAERIAKELKEISKQISTANSTIRESQKISLKDNIDNNSERDRLSSGFRLLQKFTNLHKKKEN